MLYTMNMLDLYRATTLVLEPALGSLLRRRASRGKEIPERLDERRGFAALPRPEGFLIHLHAASVGEAQSAKIILDDVLQSDSKLHILITTGTVTSAHMMGHHLPDRCLHQFVPLDHPAWVKRFYDHWQPDLTLWMESELWPNMLSEIKKRKITALLVNARLSDKSFSRWRVFKNSAHELLSAFSLVMAQTLQDAERFEMLGAKSVIATGNLKFGAKPLPCHEPDLHALVDHLRNRPVWLFASTHKGEEAMAARIHQQLKVSMPQILTLIVPRHPARRHEIRDDLESTGLVVTLRGEQKMLPAPHSDIYVADTMGELGLFYRLAPVACIGRSLSDDGGGGHNPIEAAQLQCAVLHGPHVQLQKSIYEDMLAAKACKRVDNESELTAELHALLTNQPYLEARRQAAFEFTRSSVDVVNTVMSHIKSFLREHRNAF